MLDARVRAALAPFAEAHMQKLQEELAALTSVFHFPAPKKPAKRTNGHKPATLPITRKRKPLSAKARKAISQAQKARWAKQRAADA